MKNILITGGGPNGFIGRNLAETLKTRYRVFAPSHAQLDIAAYGPLAQYIEDNDIAVVVHAAGRPIRAEGQGEYDNDMQMFRNLLRLSDRLEKMIYFGSGAEYDKSGDIVMAAEEDIGKRVPRDEYGRAKYEMNELARASKNLYNMRLFGVFGKYERWDVRLPSNLCCKALFDLPLTVRRDCAFDYLYMDDLAEAVAWFIESTPRYHDYNVCSGRPCMLTEVAQAVLTVSGKELEFTVLSDERGLDYTASNARLLREAPQLAARPLSLSIARLYEYYAAHQDRIDFEVLKNTR